MTPAVDALTSGLERIRDLGMVAGVVGAAVILVLVAAWLLVAELRRR